MRLKVASRGSNSSEISSLCGVGVAHPEPGLHQVTRRLHHRIPEALVVGLVHVEFAREGMEAASVEPRDEVPVGCGVRCDRDGSPPRASGLRFR